MNLILINFVLINNIKAVVYSMFIERDNSLGNKFSVLYIKLQFTTADNFGKFQTKN